MSEQEHPTGLSPPSTLAWVSFVALLLDTYILY